MKSKIILFLFIITISISCEIEEAATSFKIKQIRDPIFPY